MSQTSARQRTRAPATQRGELVPSMESHLDGGELSVPSQVAAVQQEIQGAMTIAMRFPRSEDDARGRLVRACDDRAFAMTAMYGFPRGKTIIKGPTVWLMREAARLWGHVRHGFEIMFDDEVGVHIRGYAWDLQLNNKKTEDAYIKKLIQRKQGEAGKTIWVVPDERDLRELVNRIGAIAERNCIRHILPQYLVNAAMMKAELTMKSAAEKDPDKHRNELVDAFGGYNVFVADLEEYLGHPIAQVTPDEIVSLRAVYQSIRDGTASWPDYVKKEPEQQAPGVEQQMSLDDLTKQTPPPETK